MAEVIETNGGRLIWNGASQQARLQNLVRRKIMLAAEKVANQVKRNISTGSPPPSDPGDFPHADTGRLRNSIFWRMDEGKGDSPSAIVGTPVDYGIFLEEGTTRMDPRPFLSRTLEEMRPEIERVLTAGGPEA